jgi:formate dehydrogenase major subunit
MYATAKSAAILWGMGVTQFYQGVETVRSLTSLAMLTGNLGKPSVGVNPVRGRTTFRVHAIWARCRIPIRLSVR